MPKELSPEQQAAWWDEMIRRFDRPPVLVTPGDDEQRQIVAALCTEARDPQTEPKRLRELANLREIHWLRDPLRLKRIRRAVLENPAAPPNLLLDCLHESPAAFCRNPAAATLDLPPNPYGRKTLGLALLLRSPRVPHRLLQQIAERQKLTYLAESASLHIALTGELDPADCEAALTDYWQRALANGVQSLNWLLLDAVYTPDLARERLRFLLPTAPDEEMPESSEPAAAPWFGFDPQTMTRREVCGRLLSRPAIGHVSDRLRGNPAAGELLLRTLALLHGPEVHRRPAIHDFAESAFWQDRVAAVLAIGPCASGKPAKPKHRAMLARLRNDGNRYVRAVAQRRIAEPEWRYAGF